MMATDSPTPADPEAETVAEAADDFELSPGAPPVAGTLELAGLDLREKALPIRPADLTRLLVGQPGLSDDDRRLFGRLCTRLGAHFHQDFYRRLGDLKTSYAQLDPDSDYAEVDGELVAASDANEDEFLEAFESTLERANYRPLRSDVIRAAVEAPNELGLNYVPDFTQFDHLRVFARGFTKIARISRNSRTKFRKRTIILDAYQRLVVVLKFKEGRDKKLGPEVRSDKLYLRMFKDVPHVDMEMHLPEQGTKVRMRWMDKAQIASPLLIGVPTAAARLLFAAAILSLDAGHGDRRPGQRGGELVLWVPACQAEAPLEHDPESVLPHARQQRQRSDPADRLGGGGGIQGEPPLLFLPLAAPRPRPGRPRRRARRPDRDLPPKT